MFNQEVYTVVTLVVTQTNIQSALLKTKKLY